jgi:hypothetical protein
MNVMILWVIVSTIASLLIGHLLKGDDSEPTEL